MHGLQRSSKDLGIFIATDRDNIERLKLALRDVDDDPLQGDASLYRRADGPAAPDARPQLGRRRQRRRAVWTMVVRDGAEDR